MKHLNTKTVSLSHRHLHTHKRFNSSEIKLEFVLNALILMRGTTDRTIQMSLGWEVREFPTFETCRSEVEKKREDEVGGASGMVFIYLFPERSGEQNSLLLDIDPAAFCSRDQREKDAWPWSLLTEFGQSWSEECGGEQTQGRFMSELSNVQWSEEGPVGLCREVCCQIYK